MTAYLELRLRGVRQELEVKVEKDAKSRRQRERILESSVYLISANLNLSLNLSA